MSLIYGRQTENRTNNLRFFAEDFGKSNPNRARLTCMAQGHNLWYATRKRKVFFFCPPTQEEFAPELSMKSDKPLKIAACTKCGTAYFVRDPTPGPYFGDMRMHDTVPFRSKGREVVTVTCPACKHQRFAEFSYER